MKDRQIDISEKESPLNKNKNMSDEGGVATEETVRKRGRPANPNKPIKIPSMRGRGRPRKDGVPIPPQPQAAKKSLKRGRGRPMKAGKPKLLKKIEATGMGQGRPKNSTKSSVVTDVERIFKPKGISALKKSPGKRGRPAKEDDDGFSSEEEVRAKPGRPSTGAVNLHIIATGRGQGRPRKSLESVGNASPPSKTLKQKRGRPSLGKTAKKVAGGAGRGRPKKIQLIPLPDAESEPEEADDSE